jgi:hypothetical protein
VDTTLPKTEHDVSVGLIITSNERRPPLLSASAPPRRADLGPPEPEKIAAIPLAVRSRRWVVAAGVASYRAEIKSAAR